MELRSLSVELRSLSVESLDISKQRYNSFMRFEKGFLGKFGENFCRTAGHLVYLRLCPAAGRIATNLTTGAILLRIKSSICIGSPPICFCS